jgi:DNA-binding NarL/FixJ family response regulator
VNILIVEDSLVLAERLTDVISQELPNVHVLGVVDRESAVLSALTRDAVDLIVLDLQLKQGTGFGVLRHLERLPRRPRVVVFTNHVLPEYRQAALALGVAAFLDKAKDIQDFPGVVRGLLTTAP